MIEERHIRSDSVFRIVFHFKENDFIFRNEYILYNYCISYNDVFDI